MSKGKQPCVPCGEIKRHRQRPVDGRQNQHMQHIFHTSPFIQDHGLPVLGAFPRNPAGQMQRNARRIAKATASCHDDDARQTPRFCPMLSIREANTMPQIRRPPTITTIVPIKRAFRPILGSAAESRPASTPASPASAEPVANAPRIPPPAGSPRAAAGPPWTRCRRTCPAPAAPRRAGPRPRTSCR